MNNESKLIFALMQIDNIINLMKENEYEQFMVSHLTALKVEMQRQLSNLSNPACASLQGGTRPLDTCPNPGYSK